MSSKFPISIIVQCMLILLQVLCSCAAEQNEVFQFQAKSAVMSNTDASKRFAPHLRYGKEVAPHVRYGKEVAPHVRYGKEVAPHVRYGKEIAPHVRYGKEIAPHLRYGKEMAPHVRYGKEAVPHVRYGKEVAPHVRYGKEVAPHVRYGKEAIRNGYPSEQVAKNRRFDESYDLLKKSSNDGTYEDEIDFNNGELESLAKSEYLNNLLETLKAMRNNLRGPPSNSNVSL
eukprot:gene7679-8515_t